MTTPRRDTSSSHQPPAKPAGRGIVRGHVTMATSALRQRLAAWWTLTSPAPPAGPVLLAPSASSVSRPDERFTRFIPGDAIPLHAELVGPPIPRTRPGRASLRRTPEVIAAHPGAHCRLHETAALRWRPHRARDAAGFGAEQPPQPALTILRTWPLSDKRGHRIRDEDMAPNGGNQQSTAGRAVGSRRLPLRLRDQPRRQHSTTLLVRTSWGSARARGDEATASRG